MDLFDKYSSKENLRDAFHYLKKELEESDLSLEPVWTPGLLAIEKLGDSFFQSLQDFLRSEAYCPDGADYIYAQKDNLGVRPICVISIVDRIIYQAILNPQILGYCIDDKLYKFCLGNRIDGKNNFLKSKNNQWIDFCKKQILAYKRKMNLRVEFDIQTYYETIQINTLISILVNEFGVKNSKLVRILSNQLTKWAENQSLNIGIPQGPYASRILANAYLHPLDEMADKMMKEGEFEYLRYGDDIVIMAREESKIIELIEYINLFLRKYNLKLNNKTKLERFNFINDINKLVYFSSHRKVDKKSIIVVRKAAKQLPDLFRKIREGNEIGKIEMSRLRYFLKTSSRVYNKDDVNNLITLMTRRPSIVSLICKFLERYFFTINKAHNKNALSVYRSILKAYSDNYFTGWTKFSVFKLLFKLRLVMRQKPIQIKNNVIVNNSSKFINAVNILYNLSNKENISSLDDLGYTIGDLIKFIQGSKSNTEKAMYYSLLTLVDFEKNKKKVLSILDSMLNSSSLEIEMIGLYLMKKRDLKLNPDKLGKFSKLYLSAIINNETAINT